VLETCPDLISIQEPDGRYRFANAAHAAVLGYAPEELVGRRPNDLIHAGDLATVREQFRRSFASGDPAEVVARMRHANGRWVTLEANGRIMVDASGEVSGIVVVSRDITERKRAEEALRESEETLKATIESTADGILVIHPERRIAYANRRFIEMWRLPRELAVAGNDSNELVSYVLDQIEDPDRFVASVEQMRWTRGERLDTVVCKDGRIFERYRRAMLKDGEIVGRVISLRDVTERKRAEDALRESEATLKVTIESTADGILVIHPERRVAYANRRFVEMWHLPEELAIAGNDSNDLVTHVLDQLVHPDEFLAMVAKIRQTPGEWRDTLTCTDGSVIELYARAMLKDGQIVGRVVSCRDVTEQIRAEEALNEQARRDPLTGLLNRRAGLSAVEERLAYAKETRRQLAVLILDLDRFKLINDRYSHETGDAALIRFSQVMTKLVGERGVVCRLGGDEFEIALDGVGLADAVRFAERLRTSLRRSLKQEQAERLPPFTVSTGIACYPEDGQSSADLARRADEAMYAAKAGGADAVCAWRELGNRQVA
jgi:diguanylate cyclase (GGDEF)-like protein/PAS domain S-box-containing protein